MGWQVGVTLAVLAALVFSGAAAAAPAVQVMQEDNRHARVWNRFAEDVYRLHQRQLAGRPIHEDAHLGGYANAPGFYREVEYRDARSGLLLSRIRWERAHPDRVHVIEVFVHDAAGRVMRDYTAAFLPDYRKAPSQTLIALHAYHGGLHAFRTFDASDARIFERCEGEVQGEPVSLMLDEAAIDDGLHGVAGPMQSALYARCFAGLPPHAGTYLHPQ